MSSYENVQTLINHFDNMPTEIIADIFSRLPPNVLVQLEDVCPRFKSISALSASRVKSFDIFTDPSDHCEFEQEEVCLEEMRVLQSVGPYVQQLTVGFSSHENQIRMDEQIERCCHGLQQLTYVGRVNTEVHHVVPELCRLEALSFIDSPIDDEHVNVFLRNAIQLKRFSLENARCDLSCLENLPTDLQDLRLVHNSRYRNENILNYLQTNRNLSKLSFAGTSFSPVDLRRWIPFLKNLKELSFNNISETYCAAIAELESLVSLDLDILNDPREVLNLFQRIPSDCRWERLALTITTDTLDSIAPYFYKLTNLKSLSLKLCGEEFGMYTHAFANFRILPNLQALTVDSQVAIDLEQMCASLPKTLRELTLTPRSEVFGLNALVKLNAIRKLTLILDHCHYFKVHQLRSLSELIENIATNNTLGALCLGTPPVGPSFNAYSPMFARLSNYESRVDDIEHNRTCNW